VRFSLEKKFFMDLWQGIRTKIPQCIAVKNAMSDYSLIADDLFERDISEAEGLLLENIYKTKIFRFNDINRLIKKLPPVAGGTFGDLKKLISSVEGRIFMAPEEAGDSEGAKHTAKKIKKSTMTEQEKYESELRGNQEALNRVELTNALYGQPCYMGENSCFGANSKSSGVYFNQSEQAFLSWLEQAGLVAMNKKLKQNFHPIKNLEPGKTRILKVQMDLYSYLDICLYCRGTMAQMLKNGKMAIIIQGFFNTGLGISIDRLSPEALQIFAFSYDGTDI
ncbi:MAG: hypothetical protein WCG04_06200, partial [Alphaproteobacteria bacterium]